MRAIQSPGRSVAFTAEDESDLLSDSRRVSVPISLPAASPLPARPPRARSEGIDEERTTTRRRARTDTRQAAVKKGEPNAGGEREGRGVIVLQNNLNFNYFGELQKRRCDSLTVCHRKINWLRLLPPPLPPSASTAFRERTNSSVSLSLYLSSSFIRAYRTPLLRTG